MVEKKLMGFAHGECLGRDSLGYTSLSLGDSKPNYEVYAYDDGSNDVVCDMIQDGKCRMVTLHRFKCFRKK